MDEKDSLTNKTHTLIVTAVDFSEGGVIIRKDTKEELEQYIF